MADFSINGEARLDTSEVNKSVSGMSALMQTGMNAVSVAMGNLLTKLASQAVQMVSTVVSTGLDFNRQMENYQLAFENLLGDAQAANDALDAIKADAASTPFDVAGLVSANRLLISTGQSAEEARQVINALGNAVSASGGGNEELQRMAANLQQIANVGQAAAVDIKQFAYAGIDIYGILSDYTGKSREEVQQLKISYDLLAEALKAASEEGGRYAGAMEAYSQTLQGRMDTLADNAAQLAGALTEGLFQAQGQLVSAAAGWIDTLRSALGAEGITGMLQAGADIAYSLVTGFASRLPDLVAAGLNGLASFGDYLTENADTLVGVGIKLLSGLVEGIRDGLPDLLYSAAKLVTAFCKAIIDHLDEIEQLGVDLIDAIVEGIANAIADIGEAVLGVIAYILGIWDGNMDSFGQIGTNAARSIADGILSGESDVQNAAKRIYEAAMRGFSGMGGGQSSGGGAGRGGGAKRSLAAHDQSYWEQVAQHFTDTGQDQKNGDYRTAAEKAAASTFDFSDALDTLDTSGSRAAEQVENLADKITKADKALTESQSAYKILSDAVQEYSEKGAISLSTWQDLMDLAPEYQALLSKQGDQLVINTAAYNELTAAQRLELETLVTQNGVTAEAIQLIDGLGLAAEETADKAGTAFSELKDKIQELVKGGPLEVVADLADALRSGDWSGAVSAIAQGLWLTITPEQQDIIYNWAIEAVKAMNDGFAKAGWSGLADAGAAVLQGLMDSGTDMGGLITGLLSQVGISGGIQGLLSTIAELAPLVLGVAASAAAVAAGVVGVAAAFKYVISQSQLLQDKVQELTDAGQTLTDELTDALDVLQPVIDLSEEMLASLDRVTSTITDTLTGIGVELMESLLPVLTEIMDTLAPVADSLQPALEAAGDLLRTVLELFGTLVSSALTALQPVLEAVGPLLETLALRLNTIATLVSNFLSPVLKVLGEVLNWLLQPILWVADAIQAAATFVVNLLNSILGFFGLKTIDLPDGSAALKGDAFDKVTNALEDNTEAIKENTELIRNPPSYQIATTGPAGGVADYSAMLAAARAEVLGQQTRVTTNYDAGGGTTQARLNASWRGTSTTVLELDGREVAKATKDYMDEELAF